MTKLQQQYAIIANHIKERLIQGDYKIEYCYDDLFEVNIDNLKFIVNFEYMEDCVIYGDMVIEITKEQHRQIINQFERKAEKEANQELILKNK